MALTVNLGVLDRIFRSFGDIYGGRWRYKTECTEDAQKYVQDLWIPLRLDVRSFRLGDATGNSEEDFPGFDCNFEEAG